MYYVGSAVNGKRALSVSEYSAPLGKAIVARICVSAREAFREGVARLYEQDAPQEEILRRIGQYVRRWKRWLLNGVRELTVNDSVELARGRPWAIRFRFTNTNSIPHQPEVGGACRFASIRCDRLGTAYGKHGSQ